MADSLYIKPLKPAELTDAYIAFMDAFSDYPLPFKLTKEQFVRKFVQKLRLDFGLSAGAYMYDGSLAGFIFTAVNQYEGVRTAYNGGTGVRVRYRGNRITTQMYEYLIPLFKANSINQCVLEVLTSNDKAIKAYKAIGFEKTKYFKCYALERSKPNYEKVDLPINREIVTVKAPNWNLYKSYMDYKPSFLDSTEMLTENLSNEVIIEMREDDVCIGFAIYQPAFGRISQIGIDPGKRRQKIGTALIDHVFKSSSLKRLSIVNVNDEATATKRFFENIGFDNQIDQFEMKMGL